MTKQRPRQRLYLVTPELGETAAFANALDTVLTTTDIAAVLLRLADADERSLVNRAKTVAAVVQRRDIALLLDGRVEIVGRVGADGAHLSGIEAFTAALPCWPANLAPITCCSANLTAAATGRNGGR
jgi:thiamine-phosphate pyrophosphorylase